MKQEITFVVASKSDIVFNGLSSILKRISSVKSVVIRYSDSVFQRFSGNSRVDFFILDPIEIQGEGVEELKMRFPEAKFFAIQTAVYPKEMLRGFHGSIGLYEEEGVIVSMISSMLNVDKKNEEDANLLTSREKEIVIGVVKGLSNKEISSRMNISVNTVMTHRRNIASKLRIHSPAGLTIYALVSKLVTLEQVKHE